MYRVIMEDLLRRIGEEDFTYNAPFCTERFLCEKYKVSRITAKRAITELETQGILYRRRGSGSFVARPANPAHKGSEIAKIKNYALLVPFNISRGGIFSLVYSATNMMSSKGGVLSLHVTQSNFESERAALECVLDMDGVVYYPSSSLPVDALDKFVRMGKPVIVLDKHHSCPQFSNVVCDNVSGGYLLTEHLCAYGHEKICYLSRFSMHSISSIRSRFDGCVKYLERFSAGLSPRFHQMGGQTVDPLDYQLLKHTVNMLVKEGFTAIECENDEVAFYTLMCCEELSVRVPEDISVTGYDNIDWSTAANKRITTVDQQFDDIGKAVAELLLADEYKPQNVVIPVRLVPRDSTGPVRSSADHFART